MTLIIRNARIWTGDAARSEAQALAIEGDRIAAVGSNAEVDERRTRATRIVDAGGRRVVAGFNDAHLHLMMGARQLSAVQLRDARDVTEFARRIAERAARAPGEWVLGGSWDEQGWASPVLPSKADVDPVTGNTPVFVFRHDVHMALANTVALRAAGITRHTSDPDGGVIVRDASGEPTGILKDHALSLVDRVLPAPTLESRREALRHAMQHAARLGVTSVGDMGPAPEDVDLYRALEARGELALRIYAAPLEIDWRPPAHAAAAPGPYLATRAVKGFTDGSLGSRTAFFFDEYSDAPGTCGLLSHEMQPLEEMRRRLVEADRHRQQVCLHAIGDRAVSMALDLAADVERANGPRDRRFRIEHAQHVQPRDLERFAALAIVASVQPYHVIDDGRWAETRIGVERAQMAYPFRAFLDRGVRLALGTDWPVAPLDPLQTMYAAVTRATLDGLRPDGWVPSQKLAVGEALGAYTTGSAFAQFAERDKGMLGPGQLADLVMLSDDVFAIDPPAIRDVRVLMTVVGGRVVHEA